MTKNKIHLFFKKTLPLQLGVFFILLTLLIALPTHNITAAELSDVEKIERITLANIEKISNRANYLYLNGDYLQASLLSNQILKTISKFPGRETVVLIKWLSDLKLDNNPPKEPYIKKTSITKLPGIVELLEVLYLQGNYRMVDVISKKLSHKEGLYFRAVALYGSNRGREAIKLLKQIKPKDPLYIISQIFYGQILAISNNHDGAIKILKTVEEQVTDGSEKSDRLHLLLGQLYFDKKQFELSEKHFIKISASSPNFKQALSGKIKSKIQNNNCKDAINIIEQENKKTIFYDSNYIAMNIEKSKCELKLDKTSTARETLVITIDDIKEIDKELQSFRIASSENDKVIDIIAKKLIRRTSRLDTTKAIQYTAKVLEKNSEIQEATYRYSTLARMQNAFRSLEKDIEKTIISVYKNTNSDLLKSLNIKVRLKLIWELQQALHDKVFDFNSSPVELKKLDGEAKERLVNIYSMWERSLHRKLTGGEKRVLHVFALEGPTGLEYLENTLYSDLLYWITLARDRSKNSVSIPEIIIDDLHKVMEGTWVDESDMFPEIDIILSHEIEEEATLITDLKKLLIKTKQQKSKTKIKTDLAFEKIKQLIRKRLTLASLELKAQTNDALLMVRKINKAIAEENK